MNTKPKPSGVFEVCVELQRDEVTPDFCKGFMVVKSKNRGIYHVFSYEIYHPFKQKYREILVYRKGSEEPVIRRSRHSKPQDDGGKTAFSVAEEVGLDGMAGVIFTVMVCEAVEVALDYIVKSPFDELDVDAVSIHKKFDIEFTGDEQMNAFERMLGV